MTDRYSYTNHISICIYLLITLASSSKHSSHLVSHSLASYSLKEALQLRSWTNSSVHIWVYRALRKYCQLFCILGRALGHPYASVLLLLLFFLLNFKQFHLSRVQRQKQEAAVFEE